MKKITWLLLSLIVFTANAQVILLQENFQDWTPEQGIAPVPPSKSPGGVEYSITKKLYDGKTEGIFKSNALIVSPAQSIGEPGRAEGNDKPTPGRVAIKGAKNYLELPKLQSIGQVKIKANAGTDLKEFKLQAATNGYFEDIPETVTACPKAVTKLYTYNLKFATPTTLRIVPLSGSSIYIWDLEISSYSNK